jgi:hypothetical protein
MLRVERTVLLTLGVMLLASPAGQAADDAAIRRAIDHGVEYLRRSQSRNGSWEHQGIRQSNFGGAGIGATALGALALLECGAKPDDPAIQKAAKYLRDASADVVFTYSIALSIIFFDRLGEVQDIPRIEVLTVRLLAGQSPNGTWSYLCPKTGENEVHLIRRKFDKQGTPEPKQPEAQERLAPQERPAEANSPRRGAFGEGGVDGIGMGLPRGDHSNTQFATFALWVGRKRGLPVKNSLAAVEANFRVTQAVDGTWGYTNAAPTNEVNPSMTCAGLIGLAVAYGLANEIAARMDTKESSEKAKAAKKAAIQDANRDPAIRHGLLALGAVLELALLPAPKPPAAGNPAGIVGDAPNAPRRLLHQSQNYFLWSLERVAVAFGLETIGDKDWYSRGADLLIASQASDGSWNNALTGVTAETAFGLLFLRRANLAPDLTANLKGRVKDPGRVTLRADKLRSNESAGLAATGNPSRPRLLLDPDSAGHPSGANADPEANRLSLQLVKGSPDTQQAELEKLRDAKGLLNTQAIALAIPRLSGKIKTQAREALAERLTRMTADTLRDKLKDESAEIRRAAAVACATKEEKQFIPDLIELLNDPEMSVIRAARAALRALAKQDFGPASDADSAGRAAALDRWRKWWATQNKSSAGP